MVIAQLANCWTADLSELGLNVIFFFFFPVFFLLEQWARLIGNGQCRVMVVRYANYTTKWSSEFECGYKAIKPDLV